MDRATKADIAELRTETKADISALRGELKADISALRTELRAEIAEVRGDVAKLRADMLEGFAYLSAEMARQIKASAEETRSWFVALADKIDAMDFRSRAGFDRRGRLRDLRDPRDDHVVMR